MYDMMWVSFIAAVGIASWLEFVPVTAFSCSLGREPNPKENGIIRWVMPLNHRLRCQCTSIYQGGFNTYTPERGFDPFYTDRPLFTDLKTEIFNYFECENCSLTCQNGGTFIDDPCHCSCDQNWTGKNCTECALTGCENNGTLNETSCTCTCPKQWIGNTCAKPRHYDCQDYLQADGNSTNGVYTIYPSKYPGGLDVFCSMSNNGKKGWIVIQRHRNKHLNFSRGWDDYKDGFGDVAARKNFWLGNEKVRQLTEDDANTWELRVSWRLQDDHWDRNNLDNFRLLGANYTLQHTGSTWIDGLNGSVLSATNMPFSTRDRDNDGDSAKNCAEESKGGWWFNGCSGGDTTHEINLNGEYIDDGTNKTGIKRTRYTGNSCCYIKRSWMKIRRIKLHP